MKSASGVVLAAILLAASAAAQPPTTSAGIQGNEPLDISSQNFEFENSQCRATYIGEVEMVQGQQRIRSPRVDAFYSRRPSTTGGAPSCSGEVERIEAAGPVYFVSPEQSARGNRGVYTASDETLVLTGDVVLTQGQNVMTGARAVMNTRTRDARVESGPSAQSNGRVRSVLFPESQPQRPQQQPAPAAPAR